MKGPTFASKCRGSGSLCGYASDRVIHLRIVGPNYQAEHALELLDHIPSVCDLIYPPVPFDRGAVLD